jgi:hypothetical protein
VTVTSRGSKQDAIKKKKEDGEEAAAAAAAQGQPVAKRGRGGSREKTGARWMLDGASITTEAEFGSCLAKIHSNQQMMSKARTTRTTSPGSRSSRSARRG